MLQNIDQVIEERREEQQQEAQQQQQNEEEQETDSPSPEIVYDEVVIEPNNSGLDSGDSDPAPVVVNALQNLSVAINGTSWEKVVTSPGDVVLSATPTNGQIASASIEGSRVYVTGLSAGSTTITVTASKAGYSTGAQSFTVTVSAVAAPQFVRARTINAFSLELVFDQEVALVDSDPAMDDGTELLHRIGTTGQSLQFSDLYGGAEVDASDRKRVLVRPNSEASIADDYTANDFFVNVGAVRSIASGLTNAAITNQAIEDGIRQRQSHYDYTGFKP